MPIYGLSEEGLRRTRRAVQLVEGVGLEGSLSVSQNQHQPVQLKLAKADAAVSPGSTGNFSWFKSSSAGAAEADQGQTYSARDWFSQGFTSGEKAILVRPIPSPHWYAFKSSSGGEDKYVAVQADDSPAYLIDQCQDVAAGGSYDVNWHLTAWEEVVDDTASTDPVQVKVKWYTPTTGIPGWYAGNRYLGCTSTGLIWTTGSAADEKVKVSGNETAAQYLEDQFEGVNFVPTYVSAQDIQIYFDSLNDGTTESMRAFVDASTIPGYSTTETQFIANSSGNTKWLTPTPAASYSSGEDLLTHWNTTGFTVRSFINAADITNHTTIGDKYLGISDGSWSWLDGSTAGADTDELVKVSSDDTSAKYLSGAIGNIGGTSDTFQTIWDLKIEGQVNSEGGKEVIRLFVDSDEMIHWTTDEGQLLGHSTTATNWLRLENYATFNTTEDLALHHQIFQGSTGAPTVRTFVHGSTLPGYTGGMTKYLGMSSGVWQWMDGTTGGGGADTDEKVKVSSDETAAQYLQEQFEGVNAGTTFSWTQDIQVQFEVLSTGADESMRAFINASTVPDYYAANTQLLGHSSGTLKWFDPSPFTAYTAGEDLELDFALSDNDISVFIDARAITSYTSSAKRALGVVSGAWEWISVSTGSSTGGAGADEKVKITIDETEAQYLGEQFTRVDSTTFTSVQDIEIDWEINNDGADEQMRGFANMSNVSGWNASYDQVLGHETGSLAFLRHVQTASYDSAQDLLMRYAISSGIIRSFIDANAITSYTTSGKRALGVNNGNWQWVEVSTGTATSGIDEKVKVSSDETAAQYLEDQFQNVTAFTTYSSTQDIAVTWDVLSTGADESMRAFVNYSGIKNWSAVSVQLLGHSSGAAQFLQPTPVDAYNFSYDLAMDWDISSATLRPFIDASALPGWTVSSKRALGIDGGTWQFIEVSTGGAPATSGIDEKVKISSDETAAQYLQDQFDNVNLGSTYNSGPDILINWDVYSTGADEYMRAFINASDQANYNGGQTQLLGHTSGVGGYLTFAPWDPYDVSEDLLMDWAKSGNALRCHIDADAITSYTTSGKRALGVIDSNWTWLELSATGADEKVKVSSDETAAQYLEDQFTDVNASAQYYSIRDFPVSWDINSTGADEQMRAFVDVRDIQRFTTGFAQLLGHTYGFTQYMQPYPLDAYDAGEDLFMDWSYSSGVLRTWIDASAISSHTTSGKRALGVIDSNWTFLEFGADELVKVSNDDTSAGYLEQKFENVNLSTTYYSNEDIPIDWEVWSTGGIETMLGYLNASNVAGWATSGIGLLGFDDGFTRFLNATPITYYNSTHDLAMSWDHGTVLRSFIDASAVTAWSTDGDWMLGISSGSWRFLSAAGGTTDTYKVMVTASDTLPEYLADQFLNVNATIQYSSAYDLPIEFDVWSTGTDESMRAFIDASDIANHATSGDLVLGLAGNGEWEFRAPYPKPVLFLSTANVSVVSSGVYAYYQSAAYGTASSGASGLTRSTCGAIQVHRSGLYVMQYRAAYQMIYGSTVAHLIRTYPKVVRGATTYTPLGTNFTNLWCDYQNLSASQEIGHDFNGFCMYPLQSGDYVQLFNTAMQAGTSLDPANNIQLWHHTMLIWQAST